MTTPLIEAVARAWDAEEAAQTGEPSPWSIPLDGGDHDARWAESRMSLAIAALTAIESAGYRIVNPDDLTPEQMAEAGNIDGPLSRGVIGAVEVYQAIVQAAPRITP